MLSRRRCKAAAALCWTTFALQAVPPSRAIPPMLQSQAMNFTVEGRISRRERGRLTVNTEENVVFHVRYDEKTKINRKNGSPVADKDLRVGADIKVDGELSESGEIYAQTIEIE